MPHESPIGCRVAFPFLIREIPTQIEDFYPTINVWHQCAGTGDELDYGSVKIFDQIKIVDQINPGPFSLPILG